MLRARDVASISGRTTWRSSNSGTGNVNDPELSSTFTTSSYGGTGNRSVYVTRNRDSRNSYHNTYSFKRQFLVQPKTPELRMKRVAVILAQLKKSKALTKGYELLIELEI